MLFPFSPKKKKKKKRSQWTINHFPKLKLTLQGGLQINYLKLPTFNKGINTVPEAVLV